MKSQMKILKGREMEVVEKSASNNNKNDDDDDDDVLLPGFRFHPTDEELVGFYLKRKVEKKPINFDLIRQIDIYKYDPWDLPKISSVGSVGEKEWYFFCRRGRKYRNSIRPNRVTGSGFWKATGIDKPINSVGGLHHCIGLKKSLVYYRGSAGKGTKTDWMMHEFRLPANKSNSVSNAKSTDIQEAEVWTLCRIFKREVSNKSYQSDWQTTRSKQSHSVSSSVTSSLDSSQTGKYKSFGVLATNENDMKPVTDNIAGHQLSLTTYVPFTASHFSCSTPYEDEYFKEENWDELRLALDPSLLYSFM